MMNLMLNTGNSIGLTGWPSALCVCRGCLMSWPCLRIHAVAQFTDTLIDIANQTIPKSHISKNKFPKVPWFNDVCKQAIREHKKAQRKLFRNPSAENVLAFEQLKAKARHIIQTQKKTSWQSFCSSFTSKSEPKTVWKTIREIKGKKIYLLFRSIRSQWKTYHTQETNCKSARDWCVLQNMKCVKVMFV